MKRFPALHALLACLLLTSRCFAQVPPATNDSSTVSPQAESDQAPLKRRFVRVGFDAAIYHPQSTISAGGAVVPEANASVTNNQTITFDAGYYLNRHLAVSLMGGLPPKPSLTGEGSVAAYGTLGSVRYGPAVLSANYHLRPFRRFLPYAGGGLVYAIILRNYDGAISGLKVHNNFGLAIQAGADYQVSRKLEVYADVKQMWLSVNADGKIGGAVPASAKVKLNPTLPSVGLTYRF